MQNKAHFGLFISWTDCFFKPYWNTLGTAVKKKENKEIKNMTDKTFTHPDDF